jgi:Uma2 family endonuclease
MSTLVKVGPRDHGRHLTLEEFESADYAEGHKYELIDGKLYVSPQPNAPEGVLDMWVLFKLHNYKLAHSDVINCVCPKARVFVPGRPDLTCPEPDVTVYRDFPLDVDLREVRWQDVSPILVVEVLSAEDPDKDLERNVELYHQVPTIKEYWIVDGRDDPNRPTLTAHRRYGKGWRSKQLSFGDTYTTRLLPGFELIVDPRK